MGMRDRGDAGEVRARPESNPKPPGTSASVRVCLVKQDVERLQLLLPVVGKWRQN